LLCLLSALQFAVAARLLFLLPDRMKHFSLPRGGCGLLLCCFIWAAAAPPGAMAAKKTYLIGGIFKNSSLQSASYAAFNFAIEQLRLRSDSGDRLAGPASFSWFGPLGGRRDRYEAAVEFVENPEDSFQISSAICRLVSRGVLAIFGPAHYKTLPMVQSMTDNLAVLYLTNSFVDQLQPDRIVHRRQKTSSGGGASRASGGGGSSSGRGGSRVHGKFLIRLKPVITQALIAIIDHENWERFFFLYDSQSALLRLRELFEAYNNRDATISADIRDLTDNSDRSAAAATVLNYIDKKSKETLKRVFLDVSDQELQRKLFAEIRSIRSSRFNYHYLIMGSDMNELNMTSFRHGGVNITGFSLLNASNPKFRRFRDEFWSQEERLRRWPTKFDNLQGVVPLSAALMLDGMEALVRAHEQLPAVRQTRRQADDCLPTLTPAYPAASLSGAIKSARHGAGAGFEGLTGWVEFNRTGYRDRFRVQVFEAGVKSELLPISEWSRDGGFRITRSKLRKKGLRLNFSNRTRVVTSILSEPFLMLRGNTSFDGTPLVGNERFTGFCADFIKQLARKIGFDYVIKPVADGNFGDDSNNGTWNGMIGELYRQEADIAVAPLTITSKREKAVDFSTPYMEVGLSVMFLRPTKAESDRFGFMKPLSMEIWMCIAFAYLGVSVVLFVVSRFSPYEWYMSQESGGPPGRVINDFSIFNSLWFALSAFMQQGGDISPRSLSGRIVGSVWWFFTLIIVSSYTANLAAFLTVERMSTPIQSYEDLAKQTKIKYGVVNSGSSKDFFRESTSQDFRRMWQFMEANPNVFVDTIQEGVNRVLNSNNDYAFLLESTMNEYYSQQNCRTMKVGGNLESGRGYGIATPSGSDLRDPINLNVLQLKEKGDISALQTKWWYEKQGSCPNQEKDDAKKNSAQSLELQSVAGLFYILVAGTAFGVVLSLLEFGYRCALLAKRKKRSFREVARDMLILSTRGRLTVECPHESSDLIDGGASRRFLK
ncbi:hypothetical protein BOX15_Mlig023176g1, partial [Macrostomum lignano]